jgi:nucleoside 2-deoxyribosyltransferase
MCKRCGLVNLEEEAAEDFAGERFTEKDKSAISITLRNEWERSGRRGSNRKLTLSDIVNIVSQYRPMNPIEKMDHALINFEKSSNYVGAKINIDPRNDYPLYYCNEPGELEAICHLLFREGFTVAPDVANPQNDFYITAKGYQKLREIKKPGRDSKQCFVAVWFTSEMNNAFEKAIKPAIEFKEEGEDTPRFEAIKIDNIEHVNDINDEIIAQIRRSRFMVCDLTGYRGGVYFEAGFAYGLGLDVIYTCRKDWTKEGPLKDNEGQEINILYDDIGNEIKIKKEGVHFDLAHRNRIEWSPDSLDDFRKRLENRIKAVIY